MPQPTLPETLELFEAWWAIRITVEELDLEKTFKLFSYAQKFIVSEEGDGDNTRIHHHILLVTDETSDQIKVRIREVYPTAKGNKSIYTKPSRDKRQLAKYTVKEGNYKYKGFTEKYIQDTFKCSKAKTDLKKDIDKLEEDYILDKIGSLVFLEKYIELKVKHDQPLYTNHIKAYMMKMMIKSHHASSKAYADGMLFQISQELHQI